MSLPPSSAARPPSTRQLAFVLDDDPRILAIVCQILVSIGFVAQQFATPAALYEELKNVSPELIVLDLALGQSDAIEVIRDLEALHYKGKVLLISGRGEATLSEIQRIGEDHGLIMVPALKKPFRASDLKNRLAAFTQSKETRLQPNAAQIAKHETRCERIDPAEALRNRWLELWYQPKVDLKSMNACGAEALLRVKHPEHGIILPAAFLPPSGSALFQPLTEFVIKQAMADWDFFAGQGQPLKLAINVPLSVLQSPSFTRLVRESLPQDPKFPGLIVEVTETDALVDPGKVREIAMQLKLCNVGISIDDFGEAHSSLARLRDLPCIELKLDRSFVSGCAKDQAKQAFCKAAIELARGFGVTVCAEGVEDAGDLPTLIALGCHSAQGFLFAKPMDRVSFVKMLRGRAGQSSQNASYGKDSGRVALRSVTA
jgi:EAL domain-containing protein (putative c-di-GMP-specific phosphodiesterase class I)/FixJ family two-component response regulator